MKKRIIIIIIIIDLHFSVINRTKQEPSLPQLVRPQRHTKSFTSTNWDLFMVGTLKVSFQNLRLHLHLREEAGFEAELLYRDRTKHKIRQKKTEEPWNEMKTIAELNLFFSR